MKPGKLLLLLGIVGGGAYYVSSRRPKIVIDAVDFLKFKVNATMSAGGNEVSMEETPYYGKDSITTYGDGWQFRVYTPEESVDFVNGVIGSLVFQIIKNGVVEKERVIDFQ